MDADGKKLNPNEPDMMQNFIDYNDARQQAESLAQKIAKQINGQISSLMPQKQQINIAVAGGTTPKLFFQSLLTQNINWQNISLTPTDERFVAADDSRSNSLMLRNAFAENSDAYNSIVAWHSKQPAKNIDDTATALSQRMKTMLPLDICVLGMGADMHIASLFPNGDNLANALDSSSQAIIMPMNAPTLSEPRLTFTANILTQAKYLHLLIKGADKKQAFINAQTIESALDAPVKIICNHPNLMIHYTD